MIKNISFYLFVGLEALLERREGLRRLCRSLELRGTVILSPEGINGFLAGGPEQIDRFEREIRLVPEFAALTFKESLSEKIPFQRLFIKIKKEIIPFGRPEVRPDRRTGHRLAPETLKDWLDQRKEVVLLDTRNGYEIRRGTFEGARDLGIRTFREFPEKLKALPPALRDKPVVMFCTGGIRCEKAAAYALDEGFREVYQLEGGILKYFETCGGKHFQGDCFVFDERVALRTDLGESS